MTDLRKAAQAALDWFDNMDRGSLSQATPSQVFNILRAALAEPVQSVVGVDYGSSDMSCKINGTLHVDGSVKINSVEYTEAQSVQSSWVGLTDDEVFNLAWDISHEQIETVEEYKLRFAAVISAALRAKNVVPERVPMTKDEMRDIFLAGISLSERGLFKLIRAVEAHHGIKDRP